MRMENPLFLMGGDFEFYCLQLKNPVGIPKIQMVFPVGITLGTRGRVFKENILTSGDRVQKFYRACVNLIAVERIKDEEQILPY